MVLALSYIAGQLAATARSNFRRVLNERGRFLSGISPAIAGKPLVSSIRSLSSLGGSEKNTSTSSGNAAVASVLSRTSRNDEEDQVLLRNANAVAAAILLATSTGIWLNPSKASSLEAATVDAEEDSKEITPSDKESNLKKEAREEEEEETTTVINWSGTHSVDVPNMKYFEPETMEQLEQIVKNCYLTNTPIRPLGAALSPNGIGFHKGGMVSLANLDKIIKVDRERLTVTVQAGARVSQVVDALREHGLTLPNLASIAEQQMGGFVQVGAHGTGAKIAPVDHYVKSLKLVTPGKGTVELSAKDGEMFHLAKVGLGCLGIVAEVTMRCIPAHNLVEHTYVLSRAEAKAQIKSLLQKHRHVRYMWIPYEDAVVVVTNDPEDEVPTDLVARIRSTPESHPIDRERYRPLTDLLAKLTADSKEPFTEETMRGMGFGELRDALLAVNPLDEEHVKLCNKAEAEFWRRCEGYQIKPSDQLLQFDCGGQQWVWEVCFPTGTYSNNNGNDMQFMDELLAGIEENKIAAHSPIEQRWTASSSSLMSPAHAHPGRLFSWVGIIMYLPTDEETQRQEITNKFRSDYCKLLRMVGYEFLAVSHWAKLEMPITVEDYLELRNLLEIRYPIDRFNAARFTYDPTNILSNDLIDIIIGIPNPAALLPLGRLNPHLYGKIKL